MAAVSGFVFDTFIETAISIVPFSREHIKIEAVSLLSMSWNIH